MERRRVSILTITFRNKLSKNCAATDVMKVSAGDIHLELKCEKRNSKSNLRRRMPPVRVLPCACASYSQPESQMSFFEYSMSIETGNCQDKQLANPMIGDVP